MNKNFKKIVFPILLVFLIVPKVIFAAWWNPFSWHFPWTKKIVPQEHVQEIVPVASTIKESPEEEKQQIDKTITPPKNEQKKIPLPVKSENIVNIPIYIPPATSANVTPSELSIYDISTVPESNSVRVNWKTNISSESKILFEGNSYFSKRGVGTIHYVDIGNLESNLAYSGTVTAIANNAWKNQNFNFKTKSTPLKITVTNQNCPSDRCTLSWKTNYKSNGRIRIYKTGSTQIVKSLNSPSENSKDHSLEFKLEPGTRYTYKIYATGDAESAEIVGELETITPCSGACA